MQSRGTREEWRERVRAWRASGLTRAEFARQAKLHPGTLTWWGWKLASEGGQRRSRRGARRRRGESPLRFVEIASAATEVVGADESCIELEVSGVRLRVGQGFRSETLARVLEVLEART